MRAYETTFVLAPSLDDSGVKSEIEAIKTIVTSGEGEITAEKEWGRRRLAYPIRDFSEGVYHILRFNLDTSGLEELNRHFRLNENVLRHLLILDEGTPLDVVGRAPESESTEGDRPARGPAREGPKPIATDATPAPAAPAPAAPAEASPATTAPAPAAEGGE